MIQMFINNEEVVCDKEFTISEEMLSTSSTILNNCYPKTWENTKDYVSNFYFPQDYSKCKIFKDNVLIFCGVVKNSGNISLNPGYPHYCSLQILDFKTFLSEGETLDFVISNKTIREAIELVVNAASNYGVVLGNVNIFGANDIIGAYSTLNKTPYDVFQYLADITGSRWSTRMIDENTIAVDFYDPTLLPRKDNIEYNTKYFEDNNIQDISFSFSTNDYRNKQIMLSDEVYGDIDYNEEVIADGYNSTYTLSSNIAILKSVIVNGEAKSIATSEEKELGIIADFYYTVGKNTIEWGGNNPISGGTRIIVTYTPLVLGRQIVYNTDEVNRINNQLNRKGIISRYEKRNDTLSSSELNKIGQSYIRYKGSAEISLKIITHNKDLFNVGDITYFEAPIVDLAQDYMVKKKITQILATVNEMFYTYELTSSFNSEQAINYFDNQRNKNSGNIQSGDFIIRNVDIENNTLILYTNLSISEETIEGNNILDCTLDSPFIE